MATKKSSGVSKNGRDSKSKRLGLKIYNNEFVFPGCIIIRQNGCKFFPGENTKLGKDYTIYSLIFGYVKFIEKSKILYVCVLKNYQFISKKKLFYL